MKLLRILAGVAVIAIPVAVIWGLAAIAYRCGESQACRPYDRIVFWVVVAFWLTVAALAMTDRGANWPFRKRDDK